MMNRKNLGGGMSVELLSSTQLLDAIRGLSGEERLIQAEFLVHLAELDRRRGYETLGYPSLWEYCARELRYRDGAIFRRVEAARLVGRFPDVAEFIRDGRLSMTTLATLREVLTPENSRRLFDSASGKSRR